MVETTAGTFTFADLFAGIGGFHAALESLGGTCVYVAEKDPLAASVYRKAWPKDDGPGFRFIDDINKDVRPLEDVGSLEELQTLVKAGKATIPEDVPEFDVLAAGFPCQAFSKSGHQRGVLDETRGTLFHNILRIVAERQPKIVFLENVRNLVGPRHRDTTFKTIVEALRLLNYNVSADPTIISPHRIPPTLGGGPQIRERVYILAIREDLVGRAGPFGGFTYPPEWDPKDVDHGWKIAETPLRDKVPAALTDTWLADAPDQAEAARLRERRGLELERYSVTAAEWLHVWESLLGAVVKRRGLERGSGISPFPGFPIWFAADDEEWCARERADADARDLGWKHDFLDKSLKFLDDYRAEIAAAGVRRKILDLTNNSWKKLEWQAGDATSLSECLIQLRPSGVRIKRATYTPALVAINQTPILGAERRRLTPYEVGRLQAFPDNVYDAMRSVGEPEGEMYKQFGNAVHVGAVVFGLTQFVHHHFGDSAPSDPNLRVLWQRCKSEPAWQSVASSAGTDE
jgi:DNA (cytosine-5)-methyltransferase 1